MSMPDLRKPHIGRKIVRIRELKDMKQEALASIMGVSQQSISRIEQSETIEDEKLQQVAKALGVTIEAIKNFNEDAAISNINTFNDASAFNFQCQFNPVEKIVELYERMLKEKDELIEMYKRQLKS